MADINHKNMVGFISVLLTLVEFTTLVPTCPRHCMVLQMITVPHQFPTNSGWFIHHVKSWFPKKKSKSLISSTVDPVATLKKWETSGSRSPHRHRAQNSGNFGDFALRWVRAEPAIAHEPVGIPIGCGASYPSYPSYPCYPSYPSYPTLSLGLIECKNSPSDMIS